MADFKYGYNLNLNHEEMLLIRDVLDLVAGHPKHSRRRIADQILEVLYQDKDLASRPAPKDVKKDKTGNMYSCVWFLSKTEIVDG